MTKTTNKYANFFVYKITNIKTNKIYIGKTYDVNKRLNKHFASAKCNSNTYLHKSMRKHGKENFKIEMLHEFTSEEDAFNKERELILKLRSNDPNIGYNLTSGGDQTKYSEQVIDDLKNKSLQLWKDKDFIIASLYSKTKLTLNDLNDIYHHYQNGMQINEICKIFNLGRGSISGILQGKRWKSILPFTPIKFDTKHHENDVYNVRNLVNNGTSYDDISKILGISIHTVKKMSKGYNGYDKFTKVPVNGNLHKIDEATILKIRNDYELNGGSFASISSKYNLCTVSVSNIICGSGNFKHLKPLKEKYRKFSNEEVKNIRYLFDNDLESIYSIAKRYCCDYKTIYNIVHYKTYKECLN